MKKIISIIIVFALLLSIVPPITASAAAEGELAVNGNKVTVTLDIPEGKTENITSLRFKLLITITTGSMNEPSFRFFDAIKSNVKDVVVNKLESGQYVVDIVLSGKKDEKIFDSNGRAQIGTLTVGLVGSNSKATVAIVGENENDAQPAVTIVNSIGQSAMTVLLSYIEPVTVTNSSGSSSGGTSSGGGGGGVIISTPRPTASPDVTASPSPSPDTSVTPAPTDNVASGDGNVDFLTSAKPKLKATVKNGSKNVTFKWNKIDGAEGYIIYKYNAKTGKYVRKKTISNPNTTSCSIKFAYATTYSFRMHAFKTETDGSRTYGAFSSTTKVTTAPSKVTGLTAKKRKGSKVTLTWKKVQRASGYQVLMSKKKNGTYSCIKTIKKGSVKKCTVKKKNGKKCYYRVRAYVKGVGNKRVYGNKSNVKSA